MSPCWLNSVQHSSLNIEHLVDQFSHNVGHNSVSSVSIPSVVFAFNSPAPQLSDVPLMAEFHAELTPQHRTSCGAGVTQS